MSIEPQPQPTSPDEQPFQFGIAHFFGIMAFLGVLLAAVVPLFRAERQAARRESCETNLKQIALALQNYHDIYRQFPPAYQVDARGKPVHSWRVLIWNLLESQPYYDAYNFNEPWNGPNNSKLAVHQRLYRCPGDSKSPLQMTNYVAIVGKGTMWPGPKSADVADLKDGTMNTIMIVEIAHSDIHWMEPRDLPLEELAEWLQPGHRPQLLANHVEGGLVAYADGSVEMLPRSVTIERLRAMATAAGGD